MAKFDIGRANWCKWGSLKVLGMTRRGNDDENVGKRDGIGGRKERRKLGEEEGRRGKCCAVAPGLGERLLACSGKGGSAQ